MTADTTPPILTLADAAAVAERALDRANLHPGATVVLTPRAVRLLLDAAEKVGAGEGAEHG